MGANVNFNFIQKGTTFNYSAFKTKPSIIEHAKLISKQTKSLYRTETDIFNDALNGLALEEAVKLFLKNKGFILKDPTSLLYDFELSCQDGKRYLIDVKGKFKAKSKTFTQSSWEKHQIQKNHLNIIYACFDCTNSINASYSGWALSENFKPSIKYNGNFIFENELM